MRPYQITVPGWMETERYDIGARCPAETKPKEFRLMLQNLVTDRFHLVLRRETREVSRYRLIVAKDGPKLSQPKKLPEYKYEEERKAAAEKQARAQMDAMMRRPHSGPSRSFSMARATMAKLAENLSGYMDRPVTDDTGLDGAYSFSLESSPDKPAAAGDNSLPSIFIAVQQQLGLKLMPGKGPVEFLVIERADKTPEAN